MAGSNPDAVVSGDDQLPGKSNYLIGNDPAHWHRDIPQFARVRYRNVYPGIDLVYYGKQQQLEYNFELAPYADPRTISFQFEGFAKPTLDRSGDLVVVAGHEEVRLKAPRVYQAEGDSTQPVAGRFVMRFRRQSWVRDRRL